MPEKPLILAIDDEEDFLDIASVYLESSGFRIKTFKGLEEAELLRNCRELQPSLALLDVFFDARPLGLDLAAAIKKNDNTSHIKVILWSSAPKPREMAADDFFDKNDDLDALAQKIRRYISAAPLS